MKTILLLSHREQACGIQQWGRRTANILSKATRYNFVYEEVEAEYEFRALVQKYNPSSIIYNYHVSTMPWLNPSILDEFRGRKQTVIIHEGFAHPENEHSFDYYIYIDPQMQIDKQWSNKVFKVGRTLPHWNGTYTKNDIINVGSFGFGFANKQYDMIVRKVNEEFDEAVINLLIPFAKFGDQYGDAARLSADRCRAEITKPGIKLNVTHDFLPENEVLDFLSRNDINAFFYADMQGRGMSSATDYALAVKRPIILTKSYMFRHINNMVDTPINIEDTSIKEVLSKGTSPLEKFYSMWSDENYIKSFEDIFDEIIK